MEARRQGKRIYSTLSRLPAQWCKREVGECLRSIELFLRFETLVEIHSSYVVMEEAWHGMAWHGPEPGSLVLARLLHL